MLIQVMHLFHLHVEYMQRLLLNQLLYEHQIQLRHEKLQCQNL